MLNFSYDTCCVNPFFPLFLLLPLIFCRKFCFALEKRKKREVQWLHEVTLLITFMPSFTVGNLRGFQFRPPSKSSFHVVFTVNKNLFLFKFNLRYFLNVKEGKRKKIIHTFFLCVGVSWMEVVFNVMGKICNISCFIFIVVNEEKLQTRWLRKCRRIDS